MSLSGKASLFVLSLASFASPILAAPVCGYWEFETQTTEWRQCVDDRGRQYCERRWNKDNRTIRTVACDSRP